MPEMFLGTENTAVNMTPKEIIFQQEQVDIKQKIYKRQ